MKNEQKDHSLPSASLTQNGLLSAALSVEEGNKLIAKFMGGKTWDNDTFLFPIGESPLQHQSEMSKYFKYDSSWDWLMPVVEKIEGFGFTFIIDGLSAYCYERGKIMDGKSGIAKTKIEAVWIAVIKFIKWQNDNAVSVGSR